MKSKILFDGRWFGAHGIGRFSYEIFNKLYNIQLAHTLGTPSSVFDFIFFTFSHLRNRNSILFSPGYNSPILNLNRFVFCVHDLNHIDIANNNSFLKSLYYRIILRRSCKKSAKVLTVSDFSKNKIMAWAGVGPDQVVNVGNGVSSVFSPVGPRHEPGYPYFFSVGNRKAHKNEARLLQAFAAAELPSTVRLVLTGLPSPELLTIMHDLNLEDRVVFAGRVDEEILASLYRGATALLFPSLYEGFGLPVVEAMASGTPVLTSNVTSLPEVAGEAALLVDPLDLSAIKTGIERLMFEPDLRASLTERGLVQATKFSWDTVAARVQAVLDEVESRMPWSKR